MVNVPKKTSDENESIQQEMWIEEKKNLSIRINLNGCESKAKVSVWAWVCECV